MYLYLFLEILALYTHLHYLRYLHIIAYYCYLHCIFALRAFSFPFCFFSWSTCCLCRKGYTGTSSLDCGSAGKCQEGDPKWQNEIRIEESRRVAQISQIFKIWMTWWLGFWVLSFFVCLFRRIPLSIFVQHFRFFDVIGSWKKSELCCAGPAFVVWLYKDGSLCSVVREPKRPLSTAKTMRKWEIRSTLESFSDSCISLSWLVRTCHLWWFFCRSSSGIWQIIAVTSTSQELAKSESTKHFAAWQAFCSVCHLRKQMIFEQNFMSKSLWNLCEIWTYQSNHETPWNKWSQWNFILWFLMVLIFHFIFLLFFRFISNGRMGNGWCGNGRDGMGLRASRWSWSRTAKPCSLGKAAAWPARRFLAPKENKEKQQQLDPDFF